MFYLYCSLKSVHKVENEWIQSAILRHKETKNKGISLNALCNKKLIKIQPIFTLISEKSSRNVAKLSLKTLNLEFHQDSSLKISFSIPTNRFQKKLYVQKLKAHKFTLETWTDANSMTLISDKNNPPTYLNNWISATLYLLIISILD